MSASPSTNGNSSVKHPPRRGFDTVPFFETGSSTPKFGSVNAASTRVDDQGLAEMIVSAMRTLADDFRQRPLTEAFYLDALAPQELLPSVTAAVFTLPELADIAADDLPGRRRILADLASGKLTRVRRHVLEIIDEHLEQAASPIRVAIENATTRAPYAFAQQADDLIARLRTFETPIPPAAAYGRFVKVSRSLGLLDGTNRGLPPQLAERLVDALKQQLDAAYLGSIEETTRQLLTDRVRGTITEFIPFVEERRRQAKQFIDNLFQVEKLLDARRTAEGHATATRSTTDVVLTGPTANELLAALRAERRVGDQLELVRLLAEEYEQALRGLVSSRYPTIAPGAPLGELLTRMTPVDLAASFRNVVAAAVASLHGVYTAIAKQGAATVVRELLRRSAVLCDLNRRDHVDLNVEPHDLIIVRLPSLIGRDDALVQQTIRDAFVNSGITCVFRDGNPEDRNLSVIRARGGMPLGLWATNDGLLQDYLGAHELGHRPHLYGLLPASPDGRAVPKIVELAKRLRQHKER